MPPVPGAMPQVIPYEPTGTAGGDMSPSFGPLISSKPTAVGPVEHMHSKHQPTARDIALSRLRNPDGTFMSGAAQARRLAIIDAQNRLEQAALRYNAASKDRQLFRIGPGRAITDPKGTFVPSPSNVRNTQGPAKIIRAILELKKLGNIKDAAATALIGHVLAGGDFIVPRFKSLPGLLSEVPTGFAYVGGGFLLARYPGAAAVPIILAGKAIQVNLSGPQPLPAGSEIPDIIARAQLREQLEAHDAAVLDALAHLEQAADVMIGALEFLDP